MYNGSISFDPYPIPLDRPPQQFLVFRYNQGNTPDTSTFDLLPNIRCEAIHFREGAEPGSADFRYVFDPFLNDPAAPLHVEQVYPLAASGPYTVHHDNRMAVGRLRADGSLQLIFDGYAQIPQANLSDKMEMVTFQVLGTPCREWDTPVGGAIYRNADNPAAVKDFETDDDVHFNPRLAFNAVDANAESGDDPFKYPVFLDEKVCDARLIGRFWTLGMAIRYLLRNANKDATYVDYAAFTSAAGVPVLDNAVSAIVPAQPGGSIDWSDPSTYTLEPIFAPDTIATGKGWPEAVEDLIAPHGFGMTFRLLAKDGEPYWNLEIYRKDSLLRLKSLYLQPYGTAVLDPGQSNVGGIKLQRDVKDLANEWTAMTAMERREASFVLAPAFEIDPTDATFPTPIDFVDGKAPDLFDAVAYRDYIFDETGDGHWDWTAGAMASGTGTSFDSVFGKGNYAVRRRPGEGTLISTDEDGKPLKAELWISTDYAGKTPGVWDRTGTWQKVTKGGWDLLKDRLGVHLSEKDPNNWNIGENFGGSKPFPSGRVQVVRNQAGADPQGKPQFALRLTCVVAGDMDIEATATKRIVSPTKFTIRRHDDLRDQIKKETISVRSHLNTTGKNQVKRDDTAKAQAHVEGRRRAHEIAKFSGSVTIPRFTTAYRIGDRIRMVRGRNIDLRTNLGDDQGESAEYPAVVGIDWTMGDNVSTTLILSDRRAEITNAARTI